mgnify:CR=1 FL=1
MKNIILIVALLSNYILQANCCNSWKYAQLKNSGIESRNYSGISLKDYPKAASYFEELKEKYPVLKPYQIVVRGSGPESDTNTIYFPFEWVQDLEDGNEFYKNVTEWVILHEVAHILYKDGIKRFLLVKLKSNNFIGYSL